MRLSSHRSSRDTKLELQLTPMIDVVFQLLIFFMVASSFTLTERNLDPAIMVKNKSATASASDLEPAIILIVPDGAGFAFQVGSQKLADSQSLRELLEKMPQKAKVDGAFVRVPNEAPFELAAAAMQASKRAGFLAVSYIPLESKK